MSKDALWVLTYSHNNMTQQQAIGNIKRSQNALQTKTVIGLYRDRLAFRCSDRPKGSIIMIYDTNKLNKKNIGTCRELPCGLASYELTSRNFVTSSPGEIRLP